MPDDESFDARCVHSPESDLPTTTPPASPPIYQTSVFTTPSVEVADRALSGEPGLYAYSRSANPTAHTFERAVAQLEGTDDAVAAASGMGAIAGVLLGLLAPGDRIAVADALYGTTRSLIDNFVTSRGVETVSLDQVLASSDVPDNDVPASHVPANNGFRLIYAETISNPLLDVADLTQLAALAQATDALLVIDNTFATPYHCRPAEFGADIVLHSASKYLGGHSDLIAGVAAGPRELMDTVRHAVKVLGSPIGPFEAWLAIRGIRTLHLRMARHAANAVTVAAHLAAQRQVHRVWYPGLPNHPSHAAAERHLQRGFGGMLSFDLGSRTNVDAFLDSLQMIAMASSLADVATTVSHPASTSHRGLSPEQRTAAGIDAGVLRLSVGVEAAEDILRDLDRGLTALRGTGDATRPTA